MRAPLDQIPTALEGHTCLLLTLSEPTHPDQPRKITLRPITLRGTQLFQAEYHLPRSTRHENLDAGGAAELVARLFPGSFAQARLCTPEADHTFHARPGRPVRVRTGPPTRRVGETAHNREKKYLIPPGTPCPFLLETGVMTPAGQVRAAMYAKFRQVNRFLELVRDVLPALPGDRVVRVVDFGCGKSYLTFALHHLLTVLHGLKVQILGLDLKVDVVRECEALARRLGCEGLEFRIGDIANHAEEGPVDLAVSLHACDTATDAALAKAVGWGCAVILAVPCCQHELAPQLRSDPLEPILEHGILRERFAALATDALRAEALELCGYATQVVEFIDLEHTSKNLLLRAVRRTGADPRAEERREAYERMKESLGVETFALEDLLRREGVW